MKKQLVYTLCAMTTVSAAASNQFHAERHGVSVTASAFASYDYVVNAEGWQLCASDFMKHGFRPVRIKIENKSNRVISVSDRSVQYPGVNISQLAEKYRYREIMRPLYYMSVRAAVIWPTALVTGLVAFFYENDPAAMICLGCIVAGLINHSIWPLADYFSLRGLNKRLVRVMTQQLHAGPVLISPGSSAEKILLLPDEVQGSFALTVFNEDAQQAEFAKFYINCL